MNKRILIFASGRGSNAEALHEAAVNGTIKGTIVGVICDHHDAPVLQRAERWRVPATVIEMKTCRDKADYNEKILEAAKAYAPDLICLAGYMRICGENLIKAFENRLTKASEELTFAEKFDKIIVNDDLEKAKQETFEVVKAFLEG